MNRFKHLNEKDGKKSMDMNSENNYTKLCGVMAGSPVYSHSSRGQDFYSFPLQVQRLSGNTDTVNVILRREQLAALEVQEAEKLCVTGELRTFNNRRGYGAKLIITVFARELEFLDEEDMNLVQLTGTICKDPNLRTTPMGRDICDLMVAVNRRYGRSDYLPCICWGVKAREASLWPVGTVVHLEGRIQSRNYIKVTEDGPMEKTAFEVSITDIEAQVPGEE